MPIPNPLPGLTIPEHRLLGLMEYGWDDQRAVGTIGVEHFGKKVTATLMAHCFFDTRPDLVTVTLVVVFPLMTGSNATQLRSAAARCIGPLAGGFPVWSNQTTVEGSQSGFELKSPPFERWTLDDALNLVTLPDMPSSIQFNDLMGMIEDESPLNGRSLYDLYNQLEWILFPSKKLAQKITKTQLGETRKAKSVVRSLFKHDFQGNLEAISGSDDVVIVIDNLLHH